MRPLLDLLYPPRCLLCDTTHGLLPGLPICRQCEAELPENNCYCQQCAVPLVMKPSQSGSQLCGECLVSSPAFSCSWSPFIYAQPLEWMIRQLKFNAKLSFGPLLSELMWHRLPVEVAACEADVIIPMPLHANRIKQRGFNQSQVLLEPIARKLQIKIDNHCCSRVRDTDHQTGKSARQRKMNIRGAFTYRHQPNYRHVIIFDDVVTTASSVTELARTLRRGGVERVDVWSLARAEKL